MPQAKDSVAVCFHHLMSAGVRVPTERSLGEMMVWLGMEHDHGFGARRGEQRRALVGWYMMEQAIIAPPASMVHACSM